MSNTSNTPIFTRRKFLAASSLATAGLVLSRTAPFAIAQPGQSPNSQINVALVGLGSQGRILLESMLNIPGLKFRAVCDIWKYALQYGRNKLKKAGHDVNVYTDIEDMLAKEKDLDVAIIATPDFWHAPHTVACHKAGLHVYCEKMMSNTIEGARSMVKASEAAGKLLQIGHQRRSNPRYLHVYNNLIKSAKLQGKFVAANGQWNRAVTDDLGFPKAYTIDAATLKKYGYRDMHQFRNWRWFRDLSGGPISDLGSHQIDIFAWFLGANPSTVFASGGIDYYKNHEWSDNVMVVYEYPLAHGTVRAFYQVQTATSSGGGYFENFMGDEGSICISENPKLTAAYREDRAPEWDQWVKKNYLRKTAAPPEPETKSVIDVRETKALAAYEIPVVLNKPIHQPHLENFFAAVQGKGKLTCDGRHAFESEVPIYRVNDSVAAKKVIQFKPEDYIA
ncbi:putative dehydrogenase [Ereboglobus sp. PH5-10]|uniref:Gfo/Idh/MocA family oxidoreductase n=1 Tax=Ereboglobus sp. PH5-10 TaxID=2940629 RepID=UPI002406711D|nr:Gfo/Idh/MocA family oxidoreductase [Ereboglobus sp. PH5-10]MDF9826453.1 putative dehydrogenase [Ereboglobus sp. PH5-10]